MTKQDAYEKIKKLVERFDEQKEFYKKSEYNETQTRRDFIDPFFKALGWDIDNENGYAESYREVIHEDKIKVGKATKAPDYSFRLVGGKRLFFVEAKKPSVAIKDDILPAYQVRRYGWSAKLSISVITDFEELAIYDCTNKPKPTDKASNARIKYLTYTDYLKEFDFIWETFSKEYVLKGSFEKYITSDKNKKGTTTVDAEFLQSLDKWRIELALNIAQRNKNITEDELNFIVQHTIDRIIFLRIAEDRGAELYGELQSSVKTGNFYKNLLHNFHVADQKYNSGLFDFNKDKISDKITIDNKVIKSIIDELYYPISPYEFSVLSVEILGSAYEQFLGKQITLSKNGKAKIEEKPEVRKAGGVYYTPQYIVDYIVKNTVGKLVEGKTPKEISKIKICDPACGSGSFLLGAYQFLLDWHKDFYTKNGKPSKGSKNDVLTPNDELTTAEKKRILINNIYGVDLDSNAVEVTKLSLLLKCMEGETQASIETQLKLFHDRILPTLDNNIKCGNSLIDLDYYDGQFDFGEERKVKPFSWKKAFPEVFNRTDEVSEKEKLSSLAQKAKHHAQKAMEYATELEGKIGGVSEPQPQYGAKGGFDVIIGNPPYVDYRLLNENEIIYFKRKYHSANTKEKYSLYIPFIELGHKLLQSNGKFGFIIPNTFLSTNMGLKLREYLVKESSITEIKDVSKLKVFGNVGTYPVLLFLDKTFNAKNEIKLAYPQSEETFLNEGSNTIKQKEITDKTDFIISTTFNKNNLSLIGKLEKSGKELGDLCGKFVWGTSITGFKSYKIQKEDFEKLKASNKENYEKVLQTADIKSYGIAWQGEYIQKSIYSKSVINLFEQKEKIVIARLTKSIQATIDYEKRYLGKSSLIVNPKVNIKYLLGLINSKLLNYYFKTKFDNTHMAGGYLRFDIPYLSKLPIKTNPTKIEETEIIKYVDQLLQLNKEKQEAKLESKIEQLQNRIDYCEDKINQIVYQLYELSEEEIKIIEGK